jgi:3-hydroxyacyl-CoA dehydrogenase/enoyl-CoA hydratase/3-hydroxybutyryl-CoA epimerase
MITTIPQKENADTLEGALWPPTGKSALPSSTSPNAAAQRIIRKLIRDDGICILTFDRHGSSANIFDRRALTELGEELDCVAADSKIKGLVLASAKRSIFIAGADIKAMSENASPEDIRKLVELGQDVMNRLAALSIPTVAAINGAAVGGGYELCLACDYRVASTDKATKIGLPETQLGLLPAWGGSTRLPRLIGLPKALEIILAGKTVAAKPALKRGMVDELVHKEYLTEAAVRILRRGKRTPNGHLLTNNALVAKVIALRLRPQMMKKTRGHYPAVLAALEVITRGVSKSIADSLALERESIVELVQGDTCRNLIRIFLLQERAKKQVIPWVGPATELKSIKKTAVIGAGVMGAGIAQWLSSRQLPVILRDINAEQVAKGMAAIAKTYKDGAKRHVFTSLEVRNGLDRIFPAPMEVPLRHVDLIIEAAVEKLELKKKIFQSLDKLAGEDTILATNTSALPISELAASTHQPERVLGLHFFNPVHRMQLVEIVAARQTSPEVLQRALSFVQQIGKLPVVVKDSPGFLVNRILMPYLIEAGNLFEAGASIMALDKAMLDFGMPMGPMRLLDEVGIDVALHVAQTIAANYGDRMHVPELLSKMAKAGLLGKKTGRGFYLHQKGKEPTENPAASGLLSRITNRSSHAMDLQERMTLLMVNEAAHCLEEEIVPDPADIDFAMIMGTGFAPFRGGPLRYADSVGAANIVAAMSRLVDSGATHFAPCALLRDLAASGKNFYQSGK